MSMVDISLNSGIYKIVNLVNNKSYIGSATKFNKRWNLHKSSLTNNKHHSSYLQRAWNKYGESNFKFEIIETCEKEKLIEREQYWLDNLKPEYNVCKVAESRLGIKSSKEHIEKIVKANTGKKKSQEQKERLRNLRLGTKLTEEQKQARRDYKHSEEAKLKIALAGKGRKHTEEAKIKMVKNRKDRKYYPIISPIMVVELNG